MQYPNIALSILSDRVLFVVVVSAHFTNSKENKMKERHRKKIFPKCNEITFYDGCNVCMIRYAIIGPDRQEFMPSL